MSLPSGELQVMSDEARVGANVDAEPDQASAAIRGRSLGQIAWRRLRRDKLAMAGGIFVILLALVAILANPLTNWYGQFPNAVHNFPPHDLLDASTQMPIGSYGGASSTHWLGGTPEIGHDVLANLIYGTRTSLIIGLLATALAVVLGVITGVVAGYLEASPTPRCPGCSTCCCRSRRCCSRSPSSRYSATSIRLPGCPGWRCVSRSSSSCSASSTSRTSDGSSAARCSPCARRSS